MEPLTKPDKPGLWAIEKEPGATPIPAIVSKTDIYYLRENNTQASRAIAFQPENWRFLPFTAEPPTFPAPLPARPIGTVCLQGNKESGWNQNPFHAMLFAERSPMGHTPQSLVKDINAGHCIWHRSETSPEAIAAIEAELSKLREAKQ